jgi:peptide-methionine (S)-S-oxide reductase
MNKNISIATLGGGCFWCIEAVFKRVEGIRNILPGYCGGTTANPDYRSVCRGATGHAEVIQFEFDTAIITYEKILGIFFKAHDPTTLNRQGADIGTQYRSVIFYHDEEQRNAALKAVKNMEAELNKKLVTETAEYKIFYPAEEYHRDYFERNPKEAYCRIVIQPKLEKLF